MMILPFYIGESYKVTERYARLPDHQKERVDACMALAKEFYIYGSPITTKNGLLSRMAKTANISKASARRMWYAFQKTKDWESFCDRRSLALRHSSPRYLQQLAVAKCMLTKMKGGANQRKAYKNGHPMCANGFST